ncbi:MAG TPA: hypothetical protein VLF62_04260 [Candidatus Saccharimonadales bacterium]|nr:hypothetical protein [Candidatus Saccharimonadales bacterium]
MSVYSQGSAGDMIVTIGDSLSMEQTAPLRSAVRQVFKTVYGSEWRHINVRDVHIEELMSKFKESAVTEYSEHSLRSYKSRISRAIQNYLSNLLESDAQVITENGPSAVNSLRTPHNGVQYIKNIVPNSTFTAWQRHKVGFQELITYPFPLSSGQIIRLSLPLQLSKADAKRLSTFIETIAINDLEDPQINLNI